MKDIIQIEKEGYPKTPRIAKGKCGDVPYVLTLEYDESSGFNKWVRLYKEEQFARTWKSPSRQELFYWKFFANRYFNKLIARHNFKEE